MPKKKYFSLQKDFKTGIFCRLAFFFGGILFFISLFFIFGGFLISGKNSGILLDVYNFSQTTIPISLLAFSFISFAIGIILYIFNNQFAKLAKIADEVEKGEYDEDIEWNEK